MTQLQKIVAKAKILKKSYPNTKWTDLIKKASKLVTPAKKSVGTPKKKKTVKRSTSRSAESEKVRAKVKKDGFIMPHGYEVTKGKRISTISGLDKDLEKKLKDAIHFQGIFKSNIEFYKLMIKKEPKMKEYYNIKLKLEKEKLAKANSIVSKLKKVN